LAAKCWAFWGLWFGDVQSTYVEEQLGSIKGGLFIIEANTKSSK